MKVYTDGACSGNPGPGGWAWAVPDGQWAAGSADHTTNQRMEVQAVLEALTVLEGAVEVVSDSTYVVNCFNDRWYEGWIKRGWRTAAKKPVANQDLWQPLIDLYQSRSDEITFSWVKGHSGDEMNDLVDVLAVRAAADQASGSGTRPGEGDFDVVGVVGPETEVDVPWPAGSAVWVVGPTGADEDDVADMVRSIKALDPAEDVVVSGLRRGPELVAAEAALEAGVRLAAVLPFADPAAGWPDDLLDRFDSTLALASWIETLDGDPLRPGTAVRDRDEWCQRSAVSALVVGDPARADALEDAGVSVLRFGS